MHNQLVFGSRQIVQQRLANPSIGQHRNDRSCPPQWCWKKPDPAPRCADRFSPDRQNDLAALRVGERGDPTARVRNLTGTLAPLPMDSDRVAENEPARKVLGVEIAFDHPAENKKP